MSPPTPPPPESRKTRKRWSIQVVVAPYVHGDWSKNRMWVTRRGGRGRCLSKRARIARDRLAAMVAAQMAGAGYVATRGVLWLRIHVCLPHHRGDAINCLDLVADAVEKGTGLDDRWYEIRCLTWEIDRANPRMVVDIGQD